MGETLKNSQYFNYRPEEGATSFMSFRTFADPWIDTF